MDADPKTAFRETKLYEIVLAWHAAGRPSRGADAIVRYAQTANGQPAGRKSASRRNEAIYDAMNVAVAACRAKHGNRWDLVEGATVHIRFPFKNYKTVIKGREATIRCRPDHRAPAPEFWPGGAIPEGVTVTPDYKHETRERGWPNGSYAAWQKAWAKRNGLVYSPELQWHRPVSAIATLPSKAA